MMQMIATLIAMVRATLAQRVRRTDERLDWFLAGHTIPRISAAMQPGVGGPELLQEQRRIETTIRTYTLQLEAQNAELRRELAQATIAAARAAQAAQQAQAPAAGGSQ